MGRTPLFPDYYWPLYQFVAGLQPQTGLEIGYCWGESAHAFLAACAQGGTLLSIDVDDYTDSVAQLNLELGDRLTFRQGDSSLVVPELPDEGYDYIYIDGDHSYDQVILDTENCLPKLKVGGVMVWDDYDRWPDVKKALDYLFGPLPAVPGHGNGARWYGNS